jgi:hypothetical protein
MISRVVTFDASRAGTAPPMMVDAGVLELNNAWLVAAVSVIR